MIDPMHKYSFSAHRQVDSPWRIERLEKIAKSVDGDVGEMLFTHACCLHFHDDKGDLTVTFLGDGLALTDEQKAAIEAAVSGAWRSDGEDGDDIHFLYS